MLEFVNADQIAVGLSAYAPEKVSFEAGRIMLRRLHELARSGSSFAFESMLSSRTFAKFLRDCKATGYQVVLFYVTLPTADLAVQRVALRVKQGGHNMPTDDIHRRFQRSLNNLFELYLPLSTKALSEQARIDLALKQAAAHARKQLAAQGLKLPTQSWKTGKISNPVV